MQGKPDIEPFLAYLLMSHFLDYHILYHHNQGEVEQMICKSLIRIYVEGISKMKSKELTLEIKAFGSLHRLVVLKVQQAR